MLYGTVKLGSVICSRVITSSCIFIYMLGLIRPVVDAFSLAYSCDISFIAIIFLESSSNFLATVLPLGRLPTEEQTAGLVCTGVITASII